MYLQTHTVFRQLMKCHAFGLYSSWSSCMAHGVCHCRRTGGGNVENVDSRLSCCSYKSSMAWGSILPVQGFSGSSYSLLEMTVPMSLKQGRCCNTRKDVHPLLTPRKRPSSPDRVLVWGVGVPTWQGIVLQRQRVIRIKLVVVKSIIHSTEQPAFKFQSSRINFLPWSWDREPYVCEFIDPDYKAYEMPRYRDAAARGPVQGVRQEVKLGNADSEQACIVTAYNDSYEVCHHTTVNIVWT